MNGKTIPASRHMTQCNLFLKATSRAAITCLGLTNHASTLYCLGRIVSLSFLCCYKLYSLCQHIISHTLTSWRTSRRTFMLTCMITTMLDKAIFASHHAHGAYAIKSCRFPTGTKLREVLCFHLSPEGR